MISQSQTPYVYFFVFFPSIQKGSKLGACFFKKININIRGVCDSCVWEHMQLWRSEENFVELIYAFHFCVDDSGDQTEFTRLIQQVPLVLSCSPPPLHVRR